MKWYLSAVAKNSLSGTSSWDLESDTINVVLVSEDYTFDQGHTSYASQIAPNEFQASSPGYSAGGQVLTSSSGVTPRWTLLSSQPRWYYGLQGYLPVQWNQVTATGSSKIAGLVLVHNSSGEPIAYQRLVPRAPSNQNVRVSWPEDGILALEVEKV